MIFFYLGGVGKTMVGHASFLGNSIREEPSHFAIIDPMGLVYRNIDTLKINEIHGLPSPKLTVST